MLKLSLLTTAARSAFKKSLLGLGLLFALGGAFSAGPAAAADWSIEKRIPTQHGWSGYWWPTLANKGFHLYDKAGKFTPLLKYYQLTGDAAPFNYEMRNKYTTDPSTGWFGHCDGFAASSIMLPEPREGQNYWMEDDNGRRTSNEIYFSVGELKGLAAAAWTDCTSDFFKGARHDQGANYNTDLRALDFHKAIVYYLHERGEGIVANISSKPEVWNFPIYEFQMQGEASTQYPGWTYVTTTIWYADDAVHPDYLGTQALKMTMTYWVKGTPSNPEQAKWADRSVYDHPQFIWHPATPGPVNKRNPINYDFVKRMVEIAADVDAADSGEPGDSGNEPPGA